MIPFAPTFAVETRAFHSYQHVTADTEHDYFKDYRSKNAFRNTTGSGLALVRKGSEDLDFGLGYSFARYSIKPRVWQDQHAVSFFSRWNFSRSDTHRIYLLGGVSRFHFSEEGSGSVGYKPVLNADLGGGISLNSERWKAGIEYKYAPTILTGDVQRKPGYGIMTSPRSPPTEVVYRLKNLRVESQELSLILALTL